MKKIFTLCISAYMLICISSFTQYTKLLDFAGTTNGSTPNGSLISDGTFLYGMTSTGGTNSYGTIFKIMPDGTGYLKLLDFDSANGSLPGGSLISDGTFLYGMTYLGGTNNLGTIFKIMPNGTGYVKLLDFAGLTNGSRPAGSLISDGTFLYGMTATGGTNGAGTIFKIKLDGTGFVKLLDFDGATNGGFPNDDLIFDGIFLYGMTNQGGTNSFGTIFKIMPDGTNFVKLLDFDGANGYYPFGALIYDGTFLYGMALAGGINDSGTVFKLMPDGTGFVKLLDLGSTNGGAPLGSLISDGTFLYGMTGFGGTNGDGTIFRIMPDGTGYLKIIDFAGATNGSRPYGSLISDGAFLYGMTSYGGTYDSGVVFKYALLGIGIDETEIFPEISIYPNPAKDKVTISIPEITNTETIQYSILNMLGEKLKGGLVTENNYQIDVFNLPEGLYFIEITVGNKKVCKKLMKAW